MNKRWMALLLGIIMMASPVEGMSLQVHAQTIGQGKTAAYAQMSGQASALVNTYVNTQRFGLGQARVSPDNSNPAVKAAAGPNFQGVSNGWHFVRSSWYYVRAGKPVTGWLKANGKWYYLGSDGAMKTGWITANGKKYYLNSNGSMRTGWLKSAGKYYYFLSNGTMRTGWLKLKKKWYYFNADGSRKTGWFTYKGKQYYFNSNGKMRTGWMRLNGHSYYFDKKGVRNETKEIERSQKATPGEKAVASFMSSRKGKLTKGEQVAAYALQFVGNPYVYGGCSLTKGTDCSGFVMLVYQHFGVSLPHYDAAIRGHGKPVSSLKAAKAGDIVCYYGHVAIYLGDGRIVHASNHRDGIKISERADYRTMAGIRRIFN